MISKLQIMMIFAGMVILILGYFFEISPQLVEKDKLQQDIIGRQAELNALKSKVAHHETGQPPPLTVSSRFHDDNGNLLVGLARLAMLNGLSVESIRHINSENRIQLSVSGAYANIIALMQIFTEQQVVMYLEDFKVKSIKGNLVRAEMDIIFVLPVTARLTMNDKNIIKIESPFCQSGEALASINEVSQLHAINEARMLGFILMGNEAHALVMFADENSQMVSVGDQIGSEHATVISINADRLSYQFPDKRTGLLLLDKE